MLRIECTGTGEKMVAISRKEIDELKDILIFTKKQKVDDKAVGYFLHLFEDGEPLQRDVVEEWQELPPTGVQADYIRECFAQALKEGLIEDRNGEFFRTAAGKERSDEVLPEGPDLA
jgi:hypothetical protein